jgi:hypothetical protein
MRTVPELGEIGIECDTVLCEETEFSGKRVKLSLNLIKLVINFGVLLSKAVSACFVVGMELANSFELSDQSATVLLGGGG